MKKPVFLISLEFRTGMLANTIQKNYPEAKIFTADPVNFSTSSTDLPITIMAQVLTRTVDKEFTNNVNLEDEKADFIVVSGRMTSNGQIEPKLLREKYGAEKCTIVILSTDMYFINQIRQFADYQFLGFDRREFEKDPTPFLEPLMKEG